MASLSLSIPDFFNVAHCIKNDLPIPFIGDVLYETMLKTKLYSKGRPRAGKDGHFYTPENTRKFEKVLRNHYAVSLPTGREIAFCPIVVEITMYDKRPKSFNALQTVMADRQLHFSSVGDVDNRAKSIIDAANGIIFSDDNQISELRVRRKYQVLPSDPEMFAMRIIRSGFSSLEIDNIGAFL